MTGKDHRLGDYIGHILEAISRTEAYTESMSIEDFRKSPLTQDAVIRNLEVIGEASRNICRDCPEFARTHPELPFVGANEMRNSLIHGYFQVDFEIVWNTIQFDLPALRSKLNAAIAE